MDGKAKSVPTITVLISRGSDDDVNFELTQAVKVAAEVVGKMKGKDIDIPSFDASSIEGLLQDAWSPLLARISQFTKLADEVTKVRVTARCLLTI